MSHEPFPYADIWDPLGRIFDSFGFDRCMWGTDWTRAVAMLTYEQGVESFASPIACLTASATRSWVERSSGFITGNGRHLETLPAAAD